MDIKTYIPEKKVRVNKEEAVPVLLDVGRRFATLGGILSFFASSFLLSIRSYRNSKKRVREFASRYERTLDLS